MVVASLLTPCLTIGLMTPALLWAAASEEQGVPAERLAWTWDLAGVILDDAALARSPSVDSGVSPRCTGGTRIGRRHSVPAPPGLRSSGWQRAACWSGRSHLCVVPAMCSCVGIRPQASRSEPGRCPGPATPMCSGSFWTLSAPITRASTDTIASTTPALDAWSKMGITFEMARSAASWTLPSHVTMFTGLWPSQHQARVDRPYLRAVSNDCRASSRQGIRDRGNRRPTCGCAIAHTALGADSTRTSIIRGTMRCRSRPRSTVRHLVLRCWSLPGGPACRYLASTRSTSTVLHARSPIKDATGSKTSRARNASAAITSRRPFFLFLNFMDVHGALCALARREPSILDGPAPT